MKREKEEVEEEAAPMTPMVPVATSVAVSFRRTHGMEDDGTPRFRIAEGARWDPGSVDSVCWWDCHPFVGTGLPLPTRFDDRAEIWYVSKHERFCSWNCVRAYNADRRQGDWMFRDGLIVALARRCTEKATYSPASHVMRAPPRSLLQTFGGAMGIDGYRAMMRTPGTLVELPSPMISVAPTVAVQRPRYTPKAIPPERVLLAKRRQAARAALARKEGSGGPSPLEAAMGLSFAPTAPTTRRKKQAA